MLKYFMVPDIVANLSSGYFSYISFANSSNYDRTVNVKYYRYSNGIQYGEIDIIVSARRIIALGDFQTNQYQPDGISLFSINLNDLSNKCILQVRCDESILISPYIGTTKFSSAPVLGNLKECEKWIESDTSLIKIKSTPYLKYVGSNTCGYLKKDKLEILKTISHEIFEEFPLSFDRRLWIGDACPITGNCNGHPNNSHKGGNSCDTNYYTINNYNSTQYGVSNEFPYISVSDGSTVNSNFDWQRNYKLIEKLYNYTENGDSRTCTSIKQFIANKLSNELKNQWNLMIQSDSGTSYNHHSHYHLEL